MASPVSSHVPIRAIAGRFSRDIARRALERVIRSCTFEFCAMIAAGEPRYLAALPREKQEWFTSAIIRGCQYDGVDMETLAPLDEEFIEKMAPAEALFMHMVTRLEWKRQISYATRKRWFLQHVRFWNDYLTRHRINLYISALTPHEIPDALLYDLCKVRGIPIVYFRATTERDASYAENDWQKPAHTLAKRYEELLEEYAGFDDPHKIPLSPQYNERFDGLTQVQGQKPAIETLKPYNYWVDIHKLFRSRPLRFIGHALQFLTPSGTKRALDAYKRWRIVRERNAFLDKHAIDPDLDRLFVYFPLHFQPEASTLPMAGAYADQLLIAQQLNAHLPDGVLIYIKEHPRESGWLMRSVDYYRDLLALKKVRLVDRATSTFALRERCLAVATATGSAGFEAIFRGKPVFLFGHCFYQYARGVYQIHSSRDCANAVHAVFNERKKPSLVESRLYLKAIEETCVRGSLDPWHVQVSKRTEEENIQASAEAILTELSTLIPTP